MANFLSSFTLLNTAALVGLIGVLIPLIIHIINRSRGTLVLLGNIDFVKQLKKIHVMEVKLTQWLLLLLRVLIIILITVLIAGINRLTGVKIVNETHLYFSPQWILTQQRSAFEEIIKKQPIAQSFILSENYPELRVDNFEKKKQLLSSKDLILHSSSWLSEIQKRPLQAKYVKIYSSNLSSEFPKQLPLIKEDTKWNFESVMDEQAIFSKIPVDIYSDKKRSLSSKLLQISFEYLKASGNNLFQVTYHPSSRVLGLSMDTKNQWIIWLSDKPVPAEIWEFVKQGNFLLTDYSSSDKFSPSELDKTTINAKVADVDAIFVGFQRALTKNELTDTVIWTDNLNGEILSSSIVGAGRHFSFNSRFNPNWNNLVENPRFPNLMSNLLTAPLNGLMTHKIAISELEKIPRITSVNRISKDLHNGIILIIALLWLTERWLSEKRKLANG